VATLISIITGCVLIGIILSAPMGPVGILCVQRTLTKGRQSGLFTGIGAAASDLFYCLITGLSMAFVDEFIKANINLLQVAGSLFLAIYAIYMIFHNPVKNMKTNIDDRQDWVRDLVTGFIFTLSNPLIVFLIITLFARFSFPGAETAWYQIVIGYVCIVAGAMLWWWVITYFVDKVRQHFNIRSIWLINRIMGGILILVALYGLLAGIPPFLRDLHII